MKKGGFHTHGHWVLLILISALALYIVYLSRVFILPIITAGILAYVSYPWFQKISNKTKHPKWSSFLTVLILATVVLVPIVIAIALLANETISLVNSTSNEDLVNMVENSRLTANNLLKLGITEAQMSEYIKAGIQSSKDILITASKWAINGISNIIFQVLFIMIFIFYSYIYGPKIFKAFYSILPFSKKGKKIFVTQMQNDIRALFLGQGLVAVIQGAIGGVGFFIAGIPNVFLWSFIMTLSSFLPIIGAWLVWVPASAYLLIQGEIFKGIFLIIWGIFIVSNVDNLLRPFIVNSMSKLDFLVVLVGVIIGIKAFNLIGIIVGPLLISILITLIKIYYAESSEDKINLDVKSNSSKTKSKSTVKTKSRTKKVNKSKRTPKGVAYSS